MFNTLRPEFQQSLLRLGQLSVEFWHRTLLLSVSGVESCGLRLHRLQNQCRGMALDDFVRLTNWKTGLDVSDYPEQIISACREAYIEEMRNSEQVALITYDEMRVWHDSFLKEWGRLAHSTLN